MLVSKTFPKTIPQNQKIMDFFTINMLIDNILYGDEYHRLEVI